MLLMVLTLPVIAQDVISIHSDKVINLQNDYESSTNTHITIDGSNVIIKSSTHHYITGEYTIIDYKEKYVESAGTTGFHFSLQSQVICLCY